MNYQGFVESLPYNFTIRGNNGYKLVADAGIAEGSLIKFKEGIAVIFKCDDNPGNNCTPYTTNSTGFRFYLNYVNGAVQLGI